MGLHIGSTAPDFEQDSTEGRIRFHDWAGKSWVVLFSHPADFTPVCTTELGVVAKLRGELEKRNAKAIALSVDPVESHRKWVGDIEETQGTKIDYPILAEPDQKVLEESADLLFHLLVLLRARGLSLGQVVRTLESRHR